MSNRIVGQVAVTGRHQWIFADNIVKNNCSPSEVIVPCYAAIVLISVFLLPKCVIFISI